MNNIFHDEVGYQGQAELGEGLVCIAMAMERFAISRSVPEKDYVEVGRTLTDVMQKLSPNLSPVNQKKFELYLVKKIGQQNQTILKEES